MGSAFTAAALDAGRLAPVAALVEAVRAGNGDLEPLVEACFRLDSGIPGDSRRDRVAVWQGSAVFVLPSATPPAISLDGSEPRVLSPVPGTEYWLRLERLEPGRLHSYRYLAGGVWSPTFDLAGYTELSYELPNVPRGTLSEERTASSRIYPEAVTRYWIYANHGIDEVRGAPVMVWHDGHRRVGDLFAYRMRIVTDNLVFVGSIPPMVHLLVSASVDRDGGSLRGLQYATVSDRYGRHLVDEVLPHASRAVKLRSDGYSRGSAGSSGGGNCSFKLAWFQPNEFSRAQSAVAPLDGYAQLVRGESHRNIRVWLSGGANDHKRDTCSNPLNNLELANALKVNGYDFSLSFGEGHHDPAQAALDLPLSLAWLWRNYDPERTEQQFEQEPSESTEPPFRVRVTNRPAT